MLAVPRGGIVAVLEGEKCADIATSLGLAHATTSAHGAKAPQLTDWSPLAGRQVAILGDEDEDGAEYASKVAAILAGLEPPAEVRIVRLPGLSDGEDIEQWAAHRRAEGRGGRRDRRRPAGPGRASVRLTRPPGTTRRHFARLFEDFIARKPSARLQRFSRRFGAARGIPQSPSFFRFIPDRGLDERHG